MYVALFARHFGESPHHLGPEQIRNYQLSLASEQEFATGSIGVADSAVGLVSDTY